MTKTLFFDLTELLYLSRGYKGFYGIAKVVAEGARTAFRSGKPIRFVAFHQSFGGFIEIFPKLDAAAEGGVDLNIPNQGMPLFTRRVFPKDRKAVQRLTAVLGPIVDWSERRKWRRSGVPFEPLDMTGAVFVSCARPKLMIHPIRALKALPNTEIHALLHDAIPLHDAKVSGEGFANSFQADTHYVIQNADQIIANSHFSANDITRFASLGAWAAPKKLTVAQLAHECQVGDSAPELELPTRPFVLMVGTSLGRKNLDVALAAIKLLVEQGKEPPLLVLAGRRRKRTMEFLDTAAMATVKPHVQQIDSPSQTDLERLYQASLAVTLASYVEGWGLPAAEALWHGRPAFCSDIEVLHEVCGDFGQYFGLKDAQTLAGYFDRITHDPTWREALYDKIAENRDKLRSWDDFGNDLIARVENAIGA